MKAAASNQGGAMTGFMGLNMAQQSGGMNAQNLFAMGQASGAPSTGQSHSGGHHATAQSWTCSCGTKNTGKFCLECGKAKPAVGVWTCACGAANTGKFCSECGKPKPQAACEKCGWKFSSNGQPPKFCPECGNRLA
jgi:membrane protease subunit (stomatin/prohibitin family)